MPQIKAKKIRLVIIFFIIIVFILIFQVCVYIKKYPGYPAWYKCPEEYGSIDEYLHDVAISTGEQMRARPDLSFENVVQERAEWFSEKDCRGWTEADWYKKDV